MVRIAFADSGIGIPQEQFTHIFDSFYQAADYLTRQVDGLGLGLAIVRRIAEAESVGVLGYCMGGTVAGIHAALEPEHVSAFVNLAGPFDFSAGGLLGTMVDARWFDAETIRFKFDADHAHLKVPHMGWNSVQVRREHPLVADWDEESRFYFVHSYYVVPVNNA